MWSLGLVLSAALVFGLSGFPALFLSAASKGDPKVSFALMAIASGLGGAGLFVGALGGEARWTVPWSLPWGAFSVGLDPLGGVFLALIFLIPTLASGYGLGSGNQAEHPDHGRLGVALGMLTGAMVLVVLARDGVLFLLAWEVMALAAFFAITTEDGDPEVRKAGWVYLIATHAGTLCLWVMWGLWSRETGSFGFAASDLGKEAATVIFVLALVGFGFKAGFMPLHFWLPGAHAHAPSHVSAVLSGVMLKMGVYGLLRVTSLIPIVSPWWGLAVLILGVVTGVLGIAFALGQQDLKRLLAYSSVENLGIVAIGVGLALLGRFEGRSEWVLLGLGGALLHVWNHGLFKPLLFFNAGAVIHATHTRSMDQMGGMAKTMPRTWALFVIAAVAIAGLPPLNGFVGEWLLGLGLFHTLLTVDSAHGAAAAIPGLTMIGALALAAFVKVGASVFQGTARNPDAQGQDPGPAQLVPMVVLAGLCLAIGLVPGLLFGSLQAAVVAWAPGVQDALPLAHWAPSMGITILGGALFGLVALGLLVVRRAQSRARRVLTWDCGYAQPTPRMQYTGSSLTDTLVRLFGFVLGPRPKTRPPGRPFALPWNVHRRVPDLVLDRALLPLSRLAGRQMRRIRFLQQGQTHVYVLSILVATLALFALAGFWRPS